MNAVNQAGTSELASNNRLEVPDESISVEDYEIILNFI